MKRAAALLFLVACGGQTSTLPHERRESFVVGDVEVAIFPAATSGTARVWLVLDVGSRDGDAPEVATTAALVAGARGEVEAQVLPDATLLGARCPSDQLEACLAPLGRAIATRDPSEAELGEALRTLRARHLRAATQAGREVEHLAFSALMGDEAARFEPLGEEAPTRETVAALLADHYGPARALVVAVGEIDRSELGAAIEASFDGVAPARSPRAPRVLDGPSHELAIEVGDRAQVAVAIAAHDLESARGVAAVLAEDTHGTITGAMVVRGGAIAMVRAPLEGEPALAFRRFATCAERVSIEGARPMPTSPRDAEEAAMLEARRWAGGRGEGELRIAYGVVVRGGRADRPRADDPDAALRERSRAALEAALEDAARSQRATPRGDASDTGAALLAENGARIGVARARTERSAVAIRFDGGSELDPPALHGRAALLASVLEMGCRRSAGRSIEVHPLVSTRSFGVVLEGAGDEGDALLDVALRCALAEGTSARAVEDARTALLATLERDARAREAAIAGSALAPSSPGSVAPLGDPAAVARLSLVLVRDALRQARVGARASVAVVGDYDPRETGQRIARRLAILAPGVVAPRATALQPVELGRFEAGLAIPKVVLRLAVTPTAEDSDVLGAQLAAHALGRALDAFPELRVTYAEGSQTRTASQVVLCVDASAAAIDRFPTLLARAMVTARASLGTLSSELLYEDGVARSRPSELASRQASDRLAGLRGEGDPADLARRLLAARPSLAVSTPSPH